MTNHPNRSMPKWTCNGFRPVRAESAQEAAAIFANRLAVREYGKRGYMRTIRLDSWAVDGSTHTFETFIGYDVGGGTTTGHNEWLYIHPARYGDATKAQAAERHLTRSWLAVRS